MIEDGQNKKPEIGAHDSSRRAAMGLGLAAAIAVLAKSATGTASAASAKRTAKKGGSGPSDEGSATMRKKTGTPARKSLPKANKQGETALGGPDTSQAKKK
jgi:hypothetical protein